METRANHVLVGSFILALVAAAVVAALWLSKVEFDRAPVRFLIYFRGNVTGLNIGSAVRYRGVPVGNVIDIRIDPANVEKIRVLIEVTDDTPIKLDTIASLGVQGITGIAFIQLSSGTQQSPRLVAERQSETPVIPSQASGLEKVIEIAPQIFEKAVVLVDRLSRLVSDKNLTAVTDTLENLRAMTERLGDQGGDLTKLMTEGRETLIALRRAADTAEKLGDELHRKSSPILDGVGEAVDELQATLTEIRGTTEVIRGVSTRLDKIIAETDAPLRDFSQGGLYELSQFIAEARILVDALTRLSKQIERDPARFFFGDTQRGYKPQ
jgi:phospholipid/cholesterol/gamma-HCH transport system substrate-binding protein